MWESRTLFPQPSRATESRNRVAQPSRATSSSYRTVTLAVMSDSFPSPTRPMATPVLVKFVRHPGTPHQDVRRFTARTDVTFSVTVRAMNERWPALRPKQLIYFDGEDEVKITNDDDLQEAIQYALQQSPPVLRLSLPELQNPAAQATLPPAAAAAAPPPPPTTVAPPPLLASPPMTIGAAAAPLATVAATAPAAAPPPPPPMPVAAAAAPLQAAPMPAAPLQAAPMPAAPPPNPAAAAAAAAVAAALATAATHLAAGPDVAQPTEAQRLSRSPPPNPLPPNFQHLPQGILRAIECTGYAMAPQPATMALPPPAELYPLQRQALQQLLDMETRDLHQELWCDVAPAGQNAAYRCPLLDLDERAARPAPAHGGLLCDPPGFGKTQIFIALILAHPPPPGQAGGTLIVVPRRLLLQWHAELQKAQAHQVAAHDHLRVHQHRVRADTASGEPASTHAELSAAQVVLTTPERLRDDATRLKSISWWRVAFDEASKHFSGKLSSQLLGVACALRARNRWLLSGTPITRSVQSLHGQFAFLGVSPFGEPHATEWWARLGAAHDARRLADLLTLLRWTMLRHSHEQRFERPPPENPEGYLIPLPPKVIEKVRVPFGVEDASHRYVYEALAHLARLEHTKPSGAANGGGGAAADAAGSEIPQNRRQELVLCASHPATVDLGPIAKRVAELQINDDDTSMITRLCTIDEVLESVTAEQAAKLGFGEAGGLSGLEHLRTHVRHDATCVECESSPSVERVIVPECLHSYCRACLHQLLGSTAAGLRVPCKHPDCGGGALSRRRGAAAGGSAGGRQQLIQRGLLRQIGTRAEVDQRERKLDPTPAWQQLDKRLPPAAGVPHSPLSALRVQVCDSNRCETAGGNADHRFAQLDRLGQQQVRESTRKSACLDDRIEVRPLRKLIKRPTEQLLTPAFGANVCYICQEAPRQAVALPCGCAGRFCTECVTQWWDTPLVLPDGRQQAPGINCPNCRDEFTVQPSLCFCSDGCALDGFKLRLETVRPPPLPTCCGDGCRQPLINVAYRCTWRLNADQMAERPAGSAATLFHTLAFHSAQCATQYFSARLDTVPHDFAGNRRLYPLGASERVLSKYSPLSRPQGGTYFGMDEVWNKYLLAFPGLPHFAFVAHYDAAGGKRVYGPQHPYIEGPKLRALIAEIAQVKRAGGKCLVFSQSSELLELAGILCERDHGIDSVLNFREMASTDVDLESEFRLHTSRFVLLLSAGAFAMGLTLTMADTCIIVEPQLDIATEIQIEHRIWRPGQMADRVRIVKLYMEGTIEEQIVNGRA